MFSRTGSACSRHHRLTYFLRMTSGFTAALFFFGIACSSSAKIVRIRRPDGTVVFKQVKDGEPDPSSVESQSPGRTTGRPEGSAPSETTGVPAGHRVSAPGPYGSGMATGAGKGGIAGTRLPGGGPGNTSIHGSHEGTADDSPADFSARRFDPNASNSYELIFGIFLGISLLIASAASGVTWYFRKLQTRQAAEFSDRLADISGKAGATAAKAVEEMTQMEDLVKEREIKELAVRAKFRDLVTASEPGKAVEALFFLLKNICGAATCAVFIRDRGFDNLFIWKHSGMDPEKASKTVLNISEISLMNLAVVRAKTLSMLDALKDPSVERTASVSHYPCVFAAPLMVGTEARGCVAVESLAMPEAHVSEETVEVMTTAAGILGPVLAGFGIFDMPMERLFLPGDDWKIESAQKAVDPIASLRGAVSPKIMEQLEKYPDLVRHSLGDRKLSYLVCRLMNFQYLWKTLDHDLFVKVMESCHEAVREVFCRFDGTMEICSDGYMRAFWGAPIRQKNHAHQAVQAALRIYSVAKRLSGDPGAEIPRLELEVAVATSEMRSVMSGPEGRKIYTAYGEAPGVASAMLRWSGGTAPIMDSETAGLVSDEIDFDPLGGVELGDFKTRNIFKVIGLKGR